MVQTTEVERLTEPSSRPKILVAASDDPDNPRVLKLCRAYLRAGYDVRFVGMDRLARRPSECVIEGVPCRYLTGGWGYSNWRLLFGYLIWGIRLTLFCMRTDAVAVHAFDLDCGLPVAVASRFRPLPFVYDVQDNYDLRHAWPLGLKQLIRFADRFTIGRASAVTVTDSNRIVGPFAPYREKITVIPNCPPDVPPPAAPAPRHAKLTVLAMGQLARQRGIELLLEATAGLPDVRVLMAGRFPDPALEAKAKALSHVEFRGWMPWEQAISLGYEADVIFSFYDPAYAVNILANSQKWFDAMMTGRPIISNREIANARWIENEGFGYLCTYGNNDELKATLLHILQHPAEAAERGRQGRRLYEQEFNWPAMEKKLFGLMQQAVQSGRQHGDKAESSALSTNG